MNVTVILAACALAGSIITAVLSYMASRRAAAKSAELETRKLDGNDFDRNKAITDTIISDLRKEVDRLKAQVAELMRFLEAEKEENRRLEELVKELTATANSLRYQITLLERQQG